MTFSRPKTKSNKIVPGLNRYLQQLKDVAGAVDRWCYTTGLRSSDRLPLPDFLGIGAQKSGTSWLAKNLRHHPDIFISEEKELHYFDLQYHRSLRYYAGHFAKANNQVKGEVTPAYAILNPEKIRFIQKVMPDLRLIYIMRNPIDRDWSHACMNLVTLPKKNLEDIRKDEFVAHFGSHRSRARGDYEQCIDRWLSSFSEDQLLIEFFDDIAKQPQQLLERVFDHLHVTRSVDWTRFPIGEKIFSGNTTPIPKELREILAEMYANDIDALYQRFGKKVAAWRISELSKRAES